MNTVFDIQVRHRALIYFKLDGNSLDNGQFSDSQRMVLVKYLSEDNKREVNIKSKNSQNKTEENSI